jgi:small subunit ribosomal protein S20
MTHSLSAAKRVRQNEKRRLANRQKASAMKTAIRRVEQAAEAGDKERLQQAVNEAYKRIDKAAKRNVIHSSTAARRKALVARKAATLKG